MAKISKRRYSQRKVINVIGDELITLSVAVMNKKKLYIKQGGRCFFCGNKFGKTFTRDHFFPKSKGNPTQGNIVLSCSICNQWKANTNPTKQEIKRYLKIYDGVIYERRKLDV